MDEARAARSQMIRRAKGPVSKNANQNVQQQRKRTRSEQHSSNSAESKEVGSCVLLHVVMFNM